MLICICKLLSIKSIQEINELLESSGHEKLTLAEQQKEFPDLPPPPAESAPTTHSSVPEKPSTTEPEPSLDSLEQDESCPVVLELPVASSSPGESRPAEPEKENPPPVELLPVDPKLPKKLDSHSNFLLITSALLILGTAIFVIPQLYSPHSSEFSISILHPQNGQ